MGRPHANGKMSLKDDDNETSLSMMMKYTTAPVYFLPKQGQDMVFPPSHLWRRQEKKCNATEVVSITHE